MLRDVYELLSAKPHEPPHERFTNEERRVYLLGYDYALIIALRVLQAASQNHASLERLRRQQRRADALVRREQRDRLRLLLTRCCAWWAADQKRFCGAPAEWLRVDATNQPIELRCEAHRTDGCHRLWSGVRRAELGDQDWVLELESGEISTKKHGPNGA